MYFILRKRKDSVTLEPLKQLKNVVAMAFNEISIGSSDDGKGLAEVTIFGSSVNTVGYG